MKRVREIVEHFQAVTHTVRLATLVRISTIYEAINLGLSLLVGMRRVEGAETLSGLVYSIPNEREDRDHFMRSDSQQRG